MRFAGIARVLLAILFVMVISNPDAARPLLYFGAPPPGSFFPFQATPYMGANIYYYGGTSGGTPPASEAVLQSVANHMVSSGLVAAGYTFLTVDAGWSDAVRDGSGKIVPPASQWPAGMPPVTKYLHDRGLRAGIYTDLGATGCGNPLGSQGHYAQDIGTFQEWGFDVVKWDRCGIDFSIDLMPLYNQVATLMPSSMQFFLSGFHDGHEEWGYGSTYPSVSSAWRVAYDEVIPNFPINWGIMTQVLYRSVHPGVVRAGAFNDADCFVIGPGTGLSDTESQSQMVMYSVLAAPLLFCSDPRNFTTPQLDFLKNAEVIAVNQDTMAAQGYRVKGTQAGAQVYSRVISPGAGTRAVALFNDTGSAATISFNEGDIGVTGPWSVRDLLAHTDLGSMTSYSTSVASHATALLKVTGGTEQVSTTKQIAAGAASAISGWQPDTTLANFPGDGVTSTTATTITTTGVTSPAPPAVYQNIRQGAAAFSAGTNLAFSASRFVEFFFGKLQVGRTFKVRLHFAEHTATAVGQRVFNVRINGQRVLNNFDIFAAAGGANKANVQEFTVVATAGFVSVDLDPTTIGRACISGIEVIPQ